MAMKGLVEGDCGGSNPLMKLTTHYTQDRGHVDEGVRIRGILGPQTLTENGLVQEFLSETHQVTSRPPQTFRMDSLLQEMRDIEGPRSLGAVPRQAPAVADLATTGETWAAEYLDTEQNVIDWSRDYLKENSLGGPDPLHHSEGFGRSQNTAPKWAEEYLTDIPVIDQNVATLGDAPTLDPQEFEDFIASVGKEAESKTGLASSATLDSAWAEEFAQFTNADMNNHVDSNNESYKQDFWRKLEDEWKDMSKEDDHPWLNDFQTSYEPFKEYDFREDNPMKEHPNALEEGKKMLEAGDLPSAVLLFEAAVKEFPENTEAWQLLGTSQAENEQDPQAISALKRCISLDPTNSAALMALAVSYTNESYQAQACHALTMWIQNNPEYANLRAGPIPQQNFKFASSFMSKELHEETTKLYITAARQKQGSMVDPDVQAGLGVLFNLSGDYSKAVDCFRAAVSARPTDALLWNRLGATLANGNRSEEAIAAYHTALRHSPGFIRCRYNLGISCVNLKAYKEAAEHFLTALNFQDAGRGPQADQMRSAMSDSIWTSLRLAVSLMRRTDLQPHLDARNVDRLSREFNVEPQTQV
eukprot:GFUD01029441.1.p1 GENE.GFUD01029441.1~~GFUD01029441.1.p1  ORF type:complete len:586 (+),score=146.75 GFUD01029441.1:262-2019(+)